MVKHLMFILSVVGIFGCGRQERAHLGKEEAQPKIEALEKKM
jgi:hypothetical protein